MSLQERTYRDYRALTQFAEQDFAGSRGSLSGKLLAIAGFGEHGTALGLAGVLCGAAILAIEGDQKKVKAALHEGHCDFMVNSLSEALRILKNALRSQQAVSVGLVGEVEQATEELAERGVSPDFFADCNLWSDHSAENQPSLNFSNAVAQLVQSGSKIFPCEAGFDFVHADAVTGRPGEILVKWTISPATQVEIVRIDRLALDVLPPEDGVRRRWLEAASRYFRRITSAQTGGATRVLSLTRPEVDRLAAALSEYWSSAARPTGRMSMTVGDETLNFGRHAG